MEKPSGQPRVFILGASFETLNMGVGALTAGAIKCLRHWNPGVEIRLLDYARRGACYNVTVLGKETLVRLVNLRFSKKLRLPNNIATVIVIAAISRLVPSGMRNRMVAGNGTLRELDSADMAASLAGGDSLSDTYGLGRFFYVALPQILVILMGKPLVQLPQTYGPFRGWLTRAVARFILENSSAVYSRDLQGVKDLNGLMGLKPGDGKVRFCYDVGFVLDPVKPEGLATKGAAFDGAAEASCTVGFNVSGLLYSSGYGNNIFGLKADYRLLVSEIIGFLITRKRARVVLVPHVFGGSGHPESDSEACMDVYSGHKAAYGDMLSVISGSFDQGGIKHIIGKCDFFIGSRMHACIAALSQCVPAVPVAYSRKFIGVMESVGAGSCVADARSLDSEGVLKVIDRAFEERAGIARRLKAEMPAVEETVLNLFSSMGLDRGLA